VSSVDISNEDKVEYSLEVIRFSIVVEVELDNKSSVDSE
jgi:hypothetical protein